MKSGHQSHNSSSSTLSTVSTSTSTSTSLSSSSPSSSSHPSNHHTTTITNTNNESNMKLRTAARPRTFSSSSGSGATTTMTASASTAPASPPTKHGSPSTACSSTTSRHHGLSFLPLAFPLTLPIGSSSSSNYFSARSSRHGHANHYHPHHGHHCHGHGHGHCHPSNYPRHKRNFFKMICWSFVGLLVFFSIGEQLFIDSHQYYSKSGNTNVNVELATRNLKGIPSNSNSNSNNNKNAGNTIQPVTAVIMNHNRPRNIQESELLPTLLLNEHITEVLLLHSNPATAFHYDHPKVRNLNATQQNQQMGLSLRFWFAGHRASNDWVLIVDDDMIVPPRTLTALLKEFAQNPHRIVGRFGRQLCWWWRTGLITHRYNTVNTGGPTEVVLTKLLLMERTICQQFHRYAPLVESDLIRPRSHPYWNGEDIFMSLVANHVYGHSTEYSASTRRAAQMGLNNYGMPWLPVGDVEDRYKGPADTFGRLDVSGNIQGLRTPWKWKVWDPKWRANFGKAFSHLKYRGDLWNHAKERLSLSLSQSQSSQQFLLLPQQGEEEEVEVQVQ